MQRIKSLSTYLIISLDIDSILIIFIQLLSTDLEYGINDILLWITGVCVGSGLLVYISDHV